MRSIGNKREPRVQSCLFLCLIVGAAVQEPRKNGMGVVALSRDGGVRTGRHIPKTASDETGETGVFSVCPAERCAVLTAQQENYDVNSLLDTPASAPAYRLKVNVKVPGFKIQSRYSRLDEMGLEVGIRSSDTSVWYFDVVPTPHNNRFFTVCVTLPEDTDRRDGSSWDTAHKCDQKTVAGTAFTSLDAQDGPSVGVVHGIEIELPRLEQGVHEVTISLLDGNRHRLAVSSSVHVWVMPPGSDSASAESAITSAAAASKRRGASMRKEAEKLKEERKQIAANYKPLHEELRSLKIEQMIDPELLAALSSGDPRQLHDLMIPVEPSVSSSSPASQVKPAQPVSLSDGIHNTVFKFKLFSEEFCRYGHYGIP